MLDEHRETHLVLLLASVLALEDRVREVRANVDELVVRHGAQSARTATCKPQHTGICTGTLLGSSEVLIF